MHHSVRTLLANIVDYAGLFPPAKQDMGAAAASYAKYLASSHAWMLGKFIVPVARLDEFERVASPLFPRGGNAEPWRISALAGEQVDADIDRVFSFNQRHAPAEGDEAGEHPTGGQAAAPAVAGGAVIDTIEVKAGSSREIDSIMRVLPEQLEAYIEIPVHSDPRGMIAAMAGLGARAKVRTGGVTVEAFPTPQQVARFLSACAAADVPFKATAGLHHPVRGEYRLTYEPGAPCAPMYGFLNLFLAAAFIKAAPGGLDETETVQMLTDAAPGAFIFADGAVTWRNRRLDVARLALVREKFAESFGSCSFEEPVSELAAMGLLEKA